MPNRPGPPAFLDDAALTPVLAALPSARIVGGAVRDWLAGRPVSDIDLGDARAARGRDPGAGRGRAQACADGPAARHGDGG